MKKMAFGIILGLLASLMFSCNKDEKTVAPDIYQTWEVESFISVESVTHAKDNNYNPIIEFKKDGSLLIKLDANNCNSNFTINANEELEIGMPGCTEICCDSDFSLKVIEMLPQVNSYNIDGGTLRLTISGWGFIKLRLH